MNRGNFEMFVGLNANAMKSIQRIKNQKMKRYGLSSAHTNCIYRLAWAGEKGVTQTELSRQEMMDPSQISRVLRELNAKGYVRMDGEEGRYRRRCVLTEEGMEMAKEIHQIIEEIEKFVSSDIPKENTDLFYQTYAHICEKLNEAESVFQE